ncbi:hypothetical protein [Streptomyces qinzhouensis]|uniref:Uncharacterized protein n=1 Tax=Streptomyces qinzhouensis TaxID=2599401 RepID=A0A5B8JDF2_9ACTN|nr:hypothetical protein [Streptomyces qinzhouensis]QDY78424.1 hypothetical protein FQU76_20150 [Streptomyces qinzhouensis]
MAPQFPSYTGSGPYCYTNSLIMVAGAATGRPLPPPAVVETLTGSAFGFQLIAGTLPLFDPYAWDPELGLDQAVALLGLDCERTAGGTAEEALERLRAAVARGPVLVGPVDMGLLLYRPGTPAPGQGDHYVVVLEAGADGTLLLHDPQGHPYARLDATAFLAAWRAETVEYTEEPFIMRSGFTHEREVTAERALKDSLPLAVGWLGGRDDLPVPPGTLGGAAGVAGFARLVKAGLDPDLRLLHGHFAVRVGARRASDAADCLDRLGLAEAAGTAREQARLIGALQWPVVTGDDPALLAGLERLAPTYGQLRSALERASG